ncbi:MAG: aminotransferase class V-fold PLP-dependent enzyme [Bdellovibrionales bacterium]|nr:aminotransferase class V-fold PLP-dependent enzyme [Bdellovibrionales bacterium]
MQENRAIFLDVNAGAPLHPEAHRALLPLVSPSSDDRALGNPSSAHRSGRRAHSLLDQARSNIAFALGAKPSEIIFTSSGSEAIQLGSRILFENAILSGKKLHWITTKVEHNATLELCDWVTSNGGRVDFIPLRPDGSPDASALEKLATPETTLVSLIWVNNETGIISPVEDALKILKTKAVPLFLDGAQAWGKIPFKLSNYAGVAGAAFSAHKIGGLAGTGILWISPSGEIQKAKKCLESSKCPAGTVLGRQERGFRGGTENLAGILAAGGAAKALYDSIESGEWSKKQELLSACRNRLQDRLLQEIPGSKVQGIKAPRNANTLNITFPGGSNWVENLDLENIAVSAGSACSSGVTRPSHVLTAMGLTVDQASATIRISLSDPLSDADLEFVVGRIAKVYSRVRT